MLQESNTFSTVYTHYEDLTPVFGNAVLERRNRERKAVTAHSLWIAADASQKWRALVQMGIPGGPARGHGLLPVPTGRQADSSGADGS